MWVDSENGREAGREKQGGVRLRARKTAKICFIYLFFSCLFFLPIYDDYDMMRFLTFSLVFYTVGGARRFGLVSVGWVKKRFGLVLGFVVLCLDWEGWRERRGVFIV